MSELPTKENPRVSHGFWERADEEIKPALGPSYGLGGRYLGMRVFHAHRRKRYETWFEDGQKWGRWTWDYSEEGA
jgi:hypothetical protein